LLFNWIKHRHRLIGEVYNDTFSKNKNKNDDISEIKIHIENEDENILNSVDKNLKSNNEINGKNENFEVGIINDEDKEKNKINFDKVENAEIFNDININKNENINNNNNNNYNNDNDVDIVTIKNEKYEKKLSLLEKKTKHRILSEKLAFYSYSEEFIKGNKINDDLNDSNISNTDNDDSFIQKNELSSRRSSVYLYVYIWKFMCRFLYV
jgi:hypothetical protein